MRVGSMFFSRHFAIGESSDIGLYEVPTLGSLFGLCIGITFASFQIWGIMLFIKARLKRSVRYCIAIGPRCFR